MENVKKWIWNIDYYERTVPGDELSSCDLCQHDPSSAKSDFNLDTYYVHMIKNLGNGPDFRMTNVLCSDCIYEGYRWAKDNNAPNVHFFGITNYENFIPRRDPWLPSESNMNFITNKDIKD